MSFVKPPCFAAHKKVLFAQLTLEVFAMETFFPAFYPIWLFTMASAAVLPVFSAGGIPAPQMPHSLVVAEHSPHLPGQRLVDQRQTLIHILVHGGFAHAEMLRRCAHGGSCICNILPDGDTSVFNWLPHTDPSQRFGKHMQHNAGKWHVERFWIPSSFFKKSPRQSSSIVGISVLQ